MPGSKSCGAIVSHTSWMQPSDRGVGGGVCLRAPRGSSSPRNDRFPSGDAPLDLTLRAELSLLETQQRAIFGRAHTLDQSGRTGITHRPK